MLQTLPSRPTDPAGSAQPVAGAYKVDISRGERIGRVSSEWFSRPDDERYLSLGALRAAVRARSERATTRTVETKTLRVEATLQVRASVRRERQRLVARACLGARHAPAPGGSPWHPDRRPRPALRRRRRRGILRQCPGR